MKQQYCQIKDGSHNWLRAKFKIYERQIWWVSKCPSICYFKSSLLSNRISSPVMQEHYMLTYWSCSIYRIASPTGACLSFQLYKTNSSFAQLDLEWCSPTFLLATSKLENTGWNFYPVSFCFSEEPALFFLFPGGFLYPFVCWDLGTSE